MSWQAYVDSSLVGTGHIDKAAIFGADGSSVWAASPGFKVNPSEISTVLQRFQTQTPEAVLVAGQKFIVLKIDPRSLYGKQGKEGIVIVKTKQAILVAHYPETVQPGNATTTVEKLADYLISVGY